MSDSYLSNKKLNAIDFFANLIWQVFHYTCKDNKMDNDFGLAMKERGWAWYYGHFDR